MLYMLPAALFFFFLAAGFFFLVFRKDIFVKISDEKKEQISHINPWSGIEDRRNIAKSVILLIVLFVGFLLSNVMGIGVDIVALIAAVFGIFLFRTDLKKYLEEGVEWAMIVFFTALFVLMGVLSASGALDPISDMLAGVLGSSNSKVTGEIFVALIIGAVGLPITGFLNGSSAALVFSHIFEKLTETATVSTGLWIAFVLSGNIGGSLTPLGSITILMALEILNREGEPISFFKYIKTTIALTLLFSVLSIGYSVALIALGL